MTSLEHDAAERPKRLSLSQIVELLLTRSTPDRSTVTLTRNAAGETQIEVTVRTGDEGEAATVEAAEAKAREVYDRLREQYPPAAVDDNAAVELTRNAKGETQIEVSVKTSRGGNLATLDAARNLAAETFANLRARFPLSTGERAGYTGAAPDGPEKARRAAESA